MCVREDIEDQLIKQRLEWQSLPHEVEEYQNMDATEFLKQEFVQLRFQMDKNCLCYRQALTFQRMRDFFTANDMLEEDTLILKVEPNSTGAIVRLS